MTAFANPKMIQTQGALCQLAEFLSRHAKFVNSHMVDFLTESHWDLQIPRAVAEELMHLPEECVRFLGTQEFFELRHVKEGKAPALTAVMKELRSNTVQALKVPTEIDKILSHSVSTTGTQLWMSKKKGYEVSVMSTFIAELARRHKASHVVDIGSGKGYLSNNLVCLHHLDVVGIECVDLNNHHAKERNKKLMHHVSSVNGKSVVKEQTHDSTHLSPCHSEDKVANYNDFREDATFYTLTARIDDTFQLKDILEQCFNKEICDILLCGLHTCGDLASSALRLFVQSSGVKCLCVVGCCYNLITEQKEAANYDGNATQKFGFPLSQYLRRSQYYLGRKARMLASQSIERQYENNADLPGSLFYRALLQKLISDKLGPESLRTDFRVGKIHNKCENFWEYVRSAAKKLHLSNFEVTEEEAAHYELLHKEDKKKLMLFQKLRICFASCIEGFILLDRLMFLLEQEAVGDAHIVQLFDPVASPRCFALFATKKN